MEGIEDSASASLDPNETLMSQLYKFFSSPVNAALTAFCGYLIYKLIRGNSDDHGGHVPVKPLPPPLAKHNMHLSELSIYDGKGSDGRVCVAILGKVYDCTKGSRFYGPEGPYRTFAGRDATRALANFDVNAVKDEWDDHSDLSPSQMSSVQEWELQFSERYDFVGKLVKDGEPLENDAEDDDDDKSTTDDTKLSNSSQNS